MSEQANWKGTVEQVLSNVHGRLVSKGSNMAHVVRLPKEKAQT